MALRIGFSSRRCRRRRCQCVGRRNEIRETECSVKAEISSKHLKRVLSKGELLISSPLPEFQLAFAFTISLQVGGSNFLRNQRPTLGLGARQLTAVCVGHPITALPHSSQVLRRDRSDLQTNDLRASLKHDLRVVSSRSSVLRLNLIGLIDARPIVSLDVWTSL